MATLASPELARYSRVAVRLHWLIALLIVVNLLLGFSRGEFERPVRAAMMDVHKATGLTILALLALHIGRTQAPSRGPPAPGRADGALAQGARPGILKPSKRFIHLECAPTYFPLCGGALGPSGPSSLNLATPRFRGVVFSFGSPRADPAATFFRSGD